MAAFQSMTARRSRSGKPVPPGGKAELEEVRAFGLNPGALRMLVHLPETLPEGAPLVVVLHGCTQRAGAYAHSAGWVTLADRLGFALLAPEQGPANNPNRCFNWFEPGDINRGSGEAASIHSMIEHMVSAHGLDRRRVFVTGLSAGGAMAAVLLSTYPETFAAGSVIAGLPFGVACNVQEAFAAMGRTARLTTQELAARVARAAPVPQRRPRLAIWHGQADGTVASGNAQALAGQWAHLHGLAERPDETVVDGAWSRSVWLDRSGTQVVELNLLRGLGHGTPLATRGSDPLGEEAPFMLEAGVSSTLETARFWGLAPANPAARPESPAARPHDRNGLPASGLEPQAGAHDQPGPAAPSGGPEDRVRDLGDGVIASVAAYVSDDVKAVIVKALTAARLLR